MEPVFIHSFKDLKYSNKLFVFGFSMNAGFPGSHMIHIRECYYKLKMAVTFGLKWYCENLEKKFFRNEVKGFIRHSIEGKITKGKLCWLGDQYCQVNLM